MFWWWESLLFHCFEIVKSTEMTGTSQGPGEPLQPEKWNRDKLSDNIAPAPICNLDSLNGKTMNGFVFCRVGSSPHSGSG